MLAAAVLAPAVAAGGGWTAEVALGGAWNLPSPLWIRQSGHPTLRLTARYATRPFEPPLYYLVRVARWSGEAEWALELIHHKIHLTHPPQEVERFAISHGYNLVLLSRTFGAGGGARVRAGAGVVVAHPESTVRGVELREDGGPLGGGYHLSGIATSLGAERPLRHASGLFLAPEARLTAAWARVPVAGGSAAVPGFALHGLAGIGYETGR